MESIRLILIEIFRLDLEDMNNVEDAYKECRHRSTIVWANPNNSDPEMMRKAREKPWSKDAKRYAKRNPSFR